MDGDEYYLDGGLYDPEGGERTDVCLKESLSHVFRGEEKPLTLELILVNGNLHLSLVETLPKDIARLGKFLRDVAEDIMDRERRAGNKL